MQSFNSLFLTVSSRQTFYKSWRVKVTSQTFKTNYGYGAEPNRADSSMASQSRTTHGREHMAEQSSTMRMELSRAKQGRVHVAEQSSTMRMELSRAR